MKKLTALASSGQTQPKASQEKKVLVGQIADSTASPRPFRREMRFLLEMPKDLYHLYQMNKLDCISEGYTGTGYLSICTKAVPTRTTYTQGKAFSQLAKAAIYKAKGHSRNQTPLFLAGPLSLIFSSTKVTASDNAEVTVSMTSEDSAGYANLSSPESGSAKYRQCRSPMPGVTVTSRNAINGLASAHMVGVCPDNLLNIKAESAFVQASGKEKGPAVSPALLSTSMISCTGESNELHHNSYLQVIGFAECQPLSQPLGSMPRDCNSFLIIRFIQAETEASPSCERAFLIPSSSGASTRKAICLLPLPWILMVDTWYAPVYSEVVGQVYDKCLPQTTKPGSATTLTGHLTTNDRIIIEVAMSNYTALIGRDKPNFTQTRPEFIDTYWIIPEYETTPYGKVSFTRQDRRIFIAMFKDSRLIWAGRQPVKYLTENVICTQLQKLPVGDIEEISIPQGMVKITPPLTIEEISTVPAAVSDIATVQGVAHV